MSSSEAVEDDLTPGGWNFTRTVGDTMTATVFTVEVDDEEVTVSEAVAQVRRQRSSSSSLVVDLEASADGAEVTVGDGVALDDLDAGTYWWDLEVVTDDHPSGLTIVAGTFTLLPDVSESEGS